MVRLSGTDASRAGRAGDYTIGGRTLLLLGILPSSLGLALALVLAAIVRHAQRIGRRLGSRRVPRASQRLGWRARRGARERGKYG